MQLDCPGAHPEKLCTVSHGVYRPPRDGVLSSPVTSTSWILSLVIGAAGGALNAVLVRHTRLLPLHVSGSRGRNRVANLGLLGNAAVGSVMSVVMFWLLERAGCGVAATGGSLPAGMALVVAFVTARAATGEADKVTLRSALCTAAGAPAAHPDTVRAMDDAPIAELISLANDLVPRRAGQR